MTLTELANKYTCDKGTEYYEAHGYTEEYAKIVPEDKKINLLEIGVWHGDSIKMWDEYNWHPETNIDGIDLDPNVRHFVSDSGRIKIFIGNQSDTNFLEKVTYLREYDFIIDDGSHSSSDILTSFNSLYKTVKPGGYYIVEDLHACNARRDSTVEAIRFLAKDAQSIDLICNNKLLIVHK